MTYQEQEPNALSLDSTIIQRFDMASKEVLSKHPAINVSPYRNPAETLKSIFEENPLILEQDLNFSSYNDMHEACIRYYEEVCRLMLIDFCTKDFSHNLEFLNTIEAFRKKAKVKSLDQIAAHTGLAKSTYDLKVISVLKNNIDKVKALIKLIKSGHATLQSHNMLKLAMLESSISPSHLNMTKEAFDFLIDTSKKELEERASEQTPAQKSSQKASKQAERVLNPINNTNGQIQTKPVNKGERIENANIQQPSNSEVSKPVQSNIPNLSSGRQEPTIGDIDGIDIDVKDTNLYVLSDHKKDSTGGTKNIIEDISLGEEVQTAEQPAEELVPISVEDVSDDSTSAGLNSNGGSFQIGVKKVFKAEEYNKVHGEPTLASAKNQTRMSDKDVDKYLLIYDIMQMCRAIDLEHDDEKDLVQRFKEKALLLPDGEGSKFGNLTCLPVLGSALKVWKVNAKYRSFESYRDSFERLNLIDKDEPLSVEASHIKASNSR